MKTVLGNVRPHLMVTDPPYGVEYDPAWRADANKWKGSNVKIGGKAMGRVSNDDSADWTEAWALFPGDVAYVWHGGLRSAEQASSLERAKFAIRSQIIWNKGRLVISRGDYHWQHEAVLVRRAQRQDRPLERQPHRVDGLGYPQAASIRDRPQHAEAGRVHEAADREQLLARPGGLRAVQRLRHDHHRGRDHRPVLPRHRADAAVRRCRGRALAGVHRRDCEAGGGRPDVRRGRGRTPRRGDEADMGRRAHKPDPASRRQVEAMAAYGIPEIDIARVVGIDPKTLRKHYRDELDMGETKANAQVAGFLFNSARSGNVTAQIFWLKTRARWRETPVELRHSGSIARRDVSELTDRN